MLTQQDLTKEILKRLTKKEKMRLKKEFKNMAPNMAHENFPFTSEQRAVLTTELTEVMEKIFDVLLINKEDPNIKDTPMRIASMYINELMVGRYSEKPRLERFPINHDHFSQSPTIINDLMDSNAKVYNGMVVKKIDIVSLCSHHFMPFFTNKEVDSYAVIAYIPTTHYLGISKFQRLANWLGSRPQLQEELMWSIYRELTYTLQTENVFVFLKNLTHTCEKLRGAKTDCGSTTSIAYGGLFNDIHRRKEVIQLVQN